MSDKRSSVNSQVKTMKINTFLHVILKLHVEGGGGRKNDGYVGGLESIVKGHFTNFPQGVFTFTHSFDNQLLPIYTLA